jgi:hypothetical protein
MKGVSQTIKEKKYGLVVGFMRRLGMISDIIAITFQLYFLGSFKKFFSRFRSVL